MINQKIRIVLAAVVGIFLVVALGMAVWEKEGNKKEMKDIEQREMENKNSPYEISTHKEQNELDQKNINETSSETTSYKSDTSTPVLSTSDWNSYAVEKKLTKKPLFEFKYPADWVLDGSVFSDNGDKVAEISPAGIVILKDNQHCFDTDFKTEYPDLIKLISQSKFKLGDIDGILRITKVPITPNIWFPNSYCIEKNGKALVLTFYEKDQNSPNRKIFESIVSTVNFSN